MRWVWAGSLRQDDPQQSAGWPRSRVVVALPHRMPATLTLPSLAMPAPSDGVTSERAIVIAAQHGSDDAFAALVRIHQRRAYAIVRAIVLSHEDAEDAV